MGQDFLDIQYVPSIKINTNFCYHNYLRILFSRSSLRLQGSEARHDLRDLDQSYILYVRDVLCPMKVGQDFLNILYIYQLGIGKKYAHTSEESSTFET